MSRYAHRDAAWYAQFETEIDNVLEEGRRIQQATPFDKTAAIACRAKMISYVNQSHFLGYPAAERELTQAAKLLKDMIDG